MMTVRLKYAAMAVLPLAVLLFLPAMNYATLFFGTRALLETVPIDPRDFLRGDYVTLSYAISEIPDDMLPGDADYDGEDLPDWRNERRRRRGGEIYVTLDLDDEDVASISKTSLDRPDGGLYLKGVMDRYWRNSCDYGLEVYYVPEGTGRELEIKMNSSSKYEVYADVRILRGKGVIKGLVVRETD